MQNYLDLMRRILETGTDRPDRTGTGTRSLFGQQLRFDLSAGFPLLTTKKLHLRSILYELLWFIRGETNIAWLKENKVSIWDEWADENGELGPVYGKQWRAWKTSAAPPHDTIDQLLQVQSDIRNNPQSRRLIVSAWNVGEVPQMALPPCHLLFQFYVADGKLSCQMYQRSADYFLGVPFNIASYSLLTMMMAKVTGLEPGEFIHVLGDVHLYHNHFEQAKLQLQREPFPPPKLEILRTPDCITKFQFEDFQLRDYQSHPHIPAPVAV